LLFESAVDGLDPPSPDAGAVGVLLSEPELSVPDVSVEEASPAAALLDPPDRLSVL